MAVVAEKKTKKKNPDQVLRQHRKHYKREKGVGENEVGSKKRSLYPD